MSGLVLKLAPKERILINGAVIENGDRRSRLSIMTPNANILRLRDAIHPEEVTTPVRRVCYIAQTRPVGRRGSRGCKAAAPARHRAAVPGPDRRRQPRPSRPGDEAVRDDQHYLALKFASGTPAAGRTASRPPMRSQ